MSTAQIIARNLFANWISFGANLVVMFFLSPFVIHTLGKVEYGIWSLLTVVAGYMGICDLGVRASTGRHIILYLGREDHERLGEVVRTSLSFFTVLGVFLLVVGCVVGWEFPSIFQSTPKVYHRIIMILMPTLALNLWLTTLSAIFSSVLTAHDRFEVARAADISILAIRTAGTVLVLKWGHGIIGLTVVIVICGILSLGVNWILAYRIYPVLKVWPLSIIRTRLRELLGYGIWAAIATNAYWIMGQLDLVMVGILIGISDVTVYSVGAMLIYYSGTIVGMIPMTYWPPLQRAAAREDMDAVCLYYIQQLRVGLAVGVPMYLGYVVFGKLFIALWMGHEVEFPHDSVVAAATVMAILSLGRLVDLPTLGASWVLAAVDRVKFVSLIACVEALANLGLSIYFVTVLHWGVIGIAAGTLCARLLVRVWIIPWHALRVASLPARSLLTMIALGTTVGAWFFTWGVLVRNFFTQESWFLFWIEVVLALLGYAPVAFWLLVPTGDKKRILLWLSRRSSTSTREAEMGDPRN